MASRLVNFLKNSSDFCVNFMNGEIQMSRLDELIAELCPDGVEYKSLEDVRHVF